MNSFFEASGVLPGVWHIRDGMGVCVTLLAGTKKALLVDTAYGLGDLKGFIGGLTSLGTEVILTHGHHDHALGAMQFSEVGLTEADREVYEEYTSFSRRRTVLAQALAKGIVPGERERERYLSLPMAGIRPVEAGERDLGGMTVRLIPCPGHTPGSLVLYVPERRLLLPGDNYNPTTWVFFHESLGPVTYRENMKRLLSLPFEHVLCPHDPRLRSRREMETFFASIGDDALKNALPSAAGEGVGVETRQVVTPDGQVFVFSREKYLRGL